MTRPTSLGLVVAVMLGACGGGRAYVPTEQQPQPTQAQSVVIVETGPQSNPPAAQLPAHTLWQGRYLCAQGYTGLTLTLDLTPDGLASATFDFGALPENPTVPSGRFLLRGTAFRQPDGSVQLSLLPDRWIARPPGWEMVALTLTSDAGGRVMRGAVSHVSCGAVELTRMQ